MEAICNTCGGKGTIITDPCGTCRGQGVVPETKTITVTFPAGIFFHPSILFIFIVFGYDTVLENEDNFCSVLFRERKRIIFLLPSR